MLHNRPYYMVMMTSWPQQLIFIEYNLSAMHCSVTKHCVCAKCFIWNISFHIHNSWQDRYSDRPSFDQWGLGRLSNMLKGHTAKKRESQVWILELWFLNLYSSSTVNTVPPQWGKKHYISILINFATDFSKIFNESVFFRQQRQDAKKYIDSCKKRQKHRIQITAFLSWFGENLSGEAWRWGRIIWGNKH